MEQPFGIKAIGLNSLNRLLIIRGRGGGSSRGTEDGWLIGCFFFGLVLRNISEFRN